MLNLQIFAGFGPCPDGTFVDSFLFMLMFYLLIGFAMYLIYKKFDASNNTLSFYLLPFIFVGLCLFAAYIYSIISLFTLGICSGGPELFPIGLSTLIDITNPRSLFYIILPFALFWICLHRYLVYKKEKQHHSKSKKITPRTKQNWNLMALSLLTLAFYILILFTWPYFSSFVLSLLYPFPFIYDPLISPNGTIHRG